MVKLEEKEGLEEVYSALIVCKSRKAKEVDPVSGFPTIITFCEDGTEHSKKILCASAFDVQADQIIGSIRHSKGFNSNKLCECCTIRRGEIYRGFEITIIGHENDREKLEKMLKRAVKKFKTFYSKREKGADEEYENLTEEEKSKMPEWIPIDPGE
jgi:hypothetical protein